MNIPHNMIGAKFGRLTVLSFAYIKCRHVYLQCQCDCGTITITQATAIRSGHTKSCGCLYREGRRTINLTHGRSYTKEYEKEYYKTHRTSFVARAVASYIKNRNTILQRHKIQYAMNPDKYRQRKRNEWLKHGERYRKTCRIWKKTNREKINEINSRRRALKRNAEGSFTLQEWRDLKAKYSHQCAWCKKKGKLTIDHIVPISKGGTNWISNIQPLCLSCNSKKGAKNIVLNEVCYGNPAV